MLGGSGGPWSPLVVVVVVIVGVRGQWWWVLDAGCVPVLLLHGVGGLSWPFVGAGGHGGRSSRLVVCWWVRVGRLGWGCSPMNDNERRMCHRSLFGCHVDVSDVAPGICVRKEKGGG